MFTIKIISERREEDQLAIYKHGRGVELRGTKKELQLAVRVGLEPKTSGFQIRRPNYSATLPTQGVLQTSIVDKVVRLLKKKVLPIVLSELENTV